MKPRLVVGISGSSGVVLGVRLLEILQARATHEVHLVITPGAARTLQIELPEWPLARVQALANVVHDDRDLAAPISSGSFLHDGMVIIPASMKTVGNLASCNAGNLLVRAADVTLKEHRRLVVVPRETPLHVGHLRLLTTLAEIGAIVVPPMMAFYQRPETVADMINHLVGRVLDLVGVENDLVRRWNGPVRP